MPLLCHAVMNLFNFIVLVARLAQLNVAISTDAARQTILQNAVIDT